MSDELIARLRAKLDARGVKYHHSHNADSLEAMLAEAESSDEPEIEAEDHEEVKEPEVAEPEIVEGLVRCRVTKWGAGKISTGRADRPFFERDEIIHAPLERAESYESKYLAEMLDD